MIAGRFVACSELRRLFERTVAKKIHSSGETAFFIASAIYRYQVQVMYFS